MIILGMTRKFLKVVIYGFLVLAMMVVGLIVLILNDSEFQLTEELEEDMGLVLPVNYSVVNGKGSVFNPPIEYTLSFADSDFVALENNVRRTTFFNDTVALDQLLRSTWRLDDPKRIWEMKGLWLETDTSYVYFQVKSDISEAMLDKRKKTFHTVMAPSVSVIESPSNSVSAPQ